MARISVEHLAKAVQKISAMDLRQKELLTEEIHLRQPHLLASCLVQSRLGADMRAVEVLLNILLVCYQAIKETGLQWPLISEAEQARQLQHTVSAIRFSEDIKEAAASDTARGQYFDSHPEQPLLAFAINEANVWLRDVSQRHTEAESDKFVLMASVNLVNCIAHSAADARRV